MAPGIWPRPPMNSSGSRTSTTVTLSARCNAAESSVTSIQRSSNPLPVAGACSKLTSKRSRRAACCWAARGRTPIVDMSNTFITGQIPSRIIPSPKGMTTLALCAAFTLLCDVPAAAQSSTAEAVPLPRAFVGAGAGLSTNDAASRMRLYKEGLARTWLVEAGAAITGRLGIGAEYSQPSAATAFTTVGAGQAQIAGRQEERVLLATVRARAIGMNRWALDLMGGAGVLFQHHESGGCVPARTLCDNTSGWFLDARAPAFVVGLEVPVRLASHFEIVTSARAFALRRGEHTSATDINLTWQYEWKSSTRAAVVVGGRVVW